MQYSKDLESIQTPGPSSARCGCCGSAVFLGRSKEGFCSFCEAHYSYDENSPINPSLEKLSGIQAMLEAGKVEDAEKGLDALVPGSSDIGLLFGAANIYKTLSDMKYYDLNYNGKGFMDENSGNIYHSLDLTSKYKEMFYKAISMIEAQTKGSPDDRLVYLGFMSYMQLKRTLDAERMLSLMKAKKNPERQYAEMVYKVELGREDGYREALELMRKGNPNAVYYLARYYAGKRRLKEAKAILEKLVSKIRMPDAVFLLHKVNRVIEETRL